MDCLVGIVEKVLFFGLACCKVFESNGLQSGVRAAHPLSPSSIASLEGAFVKPFTHSVLLFVEVKMANRGDGLAEEGGAEALEFFDGVGGVEGTGGFGVRWERRETLGHEGSGGLGSGFGGVDDGEGMVEGGEGAAEGRFEEGIVGATEEEGLGVGGFGEGLLQVDFQDFVG